MPISQWELWAVANMMVSAHGEDAEAEVNRRVESARTSGDTAGETVWRGVQGKVAELRAERPTPGVSVH